MERGLCLVLDDEPSVRRYIGTILDSEGYQVLEAADEVQASHLAKQLGDVLELIVSDIELPNGNGLAFACACREWQPSIPVVLVSGVADVIRQENPRATFTFVQKPFTPKRLLEGVQQAINGST